MQADRQILWMVVVWLAALVILPRNAESRSVSVEETLAALGNGPTLGTTVAPVTIVEFSDFQCSFCKKFWADTLPRLKETHIKKGQVRFIYRHFAILGKHSVEAAKGAECAGEQGKWVFRTIPATHFATIPATVSEHSGHPPEGGLIRSH